jgi:hypothetical protein
MASSVLASGAACVSDGTVIAPELSKTYNCDKRRGTTTSIWFRAYTKQLDQTSIPEKVPDANPLPVVSAVGTAAFRSALPVYPS